MLNSNLSKHCMTTYAMFIIWHMYYFVSVPFVAVALRSGWTLEIVWTLSDEQAQLLLDHTCNPAQCFNVRGVRQARWSSFAAGRNRWYLCVVQRLSYCVLLALGWLTSAGLLATATSIAGSVAYPMCLAQLFVFHDKLLYSYILKFITTKQKQL